MSSHKPIDVNLETAQRLQEKFEFYLIALTFTVLGLAIQTADFGGPLLGGVAELVGWVLLLVSGIVGLARLEWVTVIFRVFAAHNYAEADLEKVKDAVREGHSHMEAIEDGRRVPIAKIRQKQEAKVEEIKQRSAKLQRVTLWMYWVQKACFVLGLIALMVARAAGPVSEMLKQSGWALC